MKTIGVLALQGCVDPHVAMIERLGLRAQKVRSVEELAGCDRLIMPGGESTTMLKLLNISGLFDAIKKFAETKPVWGICAGAILCAREVEHPTQASLALTNIRAHRNFYGSQLDSFKTSLPIEALNCSIEVDFIRAPKLEPLGQSVSVLARSADNTPVLLREGKTLTSAFHTELGSDPALHRYFADI